MLTLIAEGRTAEIFESAPGEVLKLYRIDMSREAIEHELAAQSYAASQRLPVPQTGKLVELDGRLGFTMERIEGPNGMDIIFGGADVGEQADALAELQKAVLQVSGGSMPNLKQRQANRIMRTPEFSEAQKAVLLEMLTNLPTGDRLLHGDFHPANIIHTANGPVIVDWIDCSRGPIEADIARSLILFGYCGANQPSEMRTQYTNRYFEKMGCPGLQNLDQWLLAQAAARVCEETEDTPQVLAYVFSESGKLQH